MKREHDLTQGKVFGVLMRFALPYLFSCLMQALYGAVDLFVVGKYSGISAISAVNIGSQVMQIVSCFIIGISVGVTVMLGRSVGEGDVKASARVSGSAMIIFAVIALVVTPFMLALSRSVTLLMDTPKEAIAETVRYISICSLGLPFIACCNAISGILRGIGDSQSPMYFVGVACVFNIAGDLLLTGVFRMGVTGAAIATTFAQMMSALFGAIYLSKKGLPFEFSRRDIRLWKPQSLGIMKSGLPMALQDAMINVAFMLLTVIANVRGLVSSSAVGVVEKLMMFMFLVPSSMFSAVSAITAQNVGAGKSSRALEAMKFGILSALAFGCLMCGMSWLFPDLLTGIFTNDPEVIRVAGEYLRTYSIDCILVAFTFSINGYLCGVNRSMLVFVHNTISIFLIRVPVAYLMSRLFQNSLLPMGIASPMGSLSSLFIVLIYYIWLKKKGTELFQKEPYPAYQHE